jgi:predicted  nucleic acid-binding Zn-ribbon protein
VAVESLSDKDLQEFVSTYAGMIEDVKAEITKCQTFIPNIEKQIEIWEKRSDETGARERLNRLKKDLKKWQNRLESEERVLAVRKKLIAPHLAEQRRRQK